MTSRRLRKRSSTPDSRLAWPSAWPSAGSPIKILILKPSSLGDVVQALPVLRLLKRHLTQSEIYWWIDSNLASWLARDADLAGVIPFHRKRWAAPRHWLELAGNVRWMRRQKFDWVIDLQGLARSGILAWLANGGLTIGLDEAREGARGYYDVIARCTHSIHAVDWYFEVLYRLGVPVDWNFTWLPVRSESAESVRKQAGKGRWIILQPGARWFNKRWPAEFYAQLVRLIAAAHPDCRFAILGGAEDAPLGAIIGRADPERCLDLTGKVTLAEMVEWIRLAEMMVTNDTGPMHVAAALGTPLVALFGPTEPRHSGPYGQLAHALQVNLPCVPCMKPRCTYAEPLACLRSVSPALVFDAVQALLAHRVPESPAMQQ